MQKIKETTASLTRCGAVQIGAGLPGMVPPLAPTMLIERRVHSALCKCLAAVMHTTAWCDICALKGPQRGVPKNRLDTALRFPRRLPTALITKSASGSK